MSVSIIAQKYTNVNGVGVKKYIVAIALYKHMKNNYNRHMRLAALGYFMIFGARGFMATIKEIAILAGVSRGTVDRVLNNRGGVNSDTAKRVQGIAEALNYSPNLAGKTLAVRKKKLRFGYILFSSTDSNPFFQDVVRGIEAQAGEMREIGVTVDIRNAKIDAPDLQASIIEELH